MVFQKKNKNCPRIRITFCDKEASETWIGDYCSSLTIFLSILTLALLTKGDVFLLRRIIQFLRYLVLLLLLLVTLQPHGSIKRWNALITKRKSRFRSANPKYTEASREWYYTPVKEHNVSLRVSLFVNFEPPKNLNWRRSAFLRKVSWISSHI